MAAIGDVLVKFVADFAEFSAGMEKGIKGLEDFAKAATETHKSIQSLITLAKAAAVVTAIYEGAQKVAKWVEETARASQEQEQLAKKLGISADNVEALQKAAKATGQTFDQQAAYYMKNKGALDELTRQMRDTNQLMNGEVRASAATVAIEMDRLSDTVGRTQKAFSSGTLSTATSGFFGLIARSITAVGQSLALMETHRSGWDIVKEILVTFASAAGFAGVMNSPIERALNKITEYEQAVVAARREVRKLEEEKPDTGAFTASDRQAVIDKFNADQAERLAAARAKQAEAEKTLVDAQNAYRKGQQIIADSQKPFVPPKVDVPTGGGAGKSDFESVEALIERYNKMANAAQEATAAVRNNVAVDISDLSILVEAKKETQDTLARIQQHRVVGPEQQKQLEQAILNAKLYQAETQRAQQYAAAAEKTEERLGDGTEAHNKAQRELNRQMATGRLTTLAYTRAAKEQEEQLRQTQLAARRYDDNLGSLAAGMEAAANASARANDMYSLGERTFTGLTDAMGEGLDVLLGKSNKTFGEIAADFASMLAKMAAQAALSQVFKMIFGSTVDPLLATGTAAAQAAVNTYGTVTYTGKAAGGPVYGGRPYIVGENGPELFVPKAAGTIVPNNQIAGDNITINVAMGQTQGASDPASALAMGRRIKAAMADVINNEKRPGGALYYRMSG